MAGQHRWPFRESLEVEARWDWQRGRLVLTDESRRAFDCIVTEALEAVDPQAWGERRTTTVELVLSARPRRERS